METYMRRVSTSFLGEPARHKCAVRLPKFYRNALLCDVIDVSKDQRIACGKSTTLETATQCSIHDE